MYNCGPKLQQLRFNINTGKTITILPRSEIVAEFALPSSAIWESYLTRSRAVSRPDEFVFEALEIPENDLAPSSGATSVGLHRVGAQSKKMVIKAAVEVSENGLAPSSGATSVRPPSSGGSIKSSNRQNDLISSRQINLISSEEPHVPSTM